MIRIIFILSLLLQCNIFSQNLPYTILISFDGFRWDYSLREITPTLDVLKAEGVHAISLRPAFPTKTFPNHFAIISGMYNDKHGIISNNFMDLENDYYSLSDKKSVEKTKWYKGEALWETLEKNAIICASQFWPGSIIGNGRGPTFRENYEHSRTKEKRIEKIIDYLELPFSKRPKFISTYFHDTDNSGHTYGPNSVENNNTIIVLDNTIKLLLDELTNIGLQDSTNIIIVSDHGMTEISKDRFVFIDKILNNYDVVYQDNGPFMTIKPNPNEISEVYKTLINNKNHFDVYTKENIPSYFHYSKDPNIYPIILSADLGWSFVTNKSAKGLGKSNGTHGYAKDLLDMHGTFIAWGPSFKKGYKTGTVWNIDIYPLICKIYNIEPNPNIDGDLERVEFLLVD